MAQIETKKLTLGYDRHTVIDDLDLVIPERGMTVMIGANGCGKSTLLRALARLIKPQGGSVLLDRESIHQLPTKQIAKKLAILPQSPTTPEGLTVYQLVRQGRYPHQSFFQRWTEKDEAAVQSAFGATHLHDLKERSVNALSGGQRQRVWLAMTLAQETHTILLDEPTTFLDLSHQIDILDLLYQLNRQQHCTIVMVLHDLNLAFRYADHLIAIKDHTVYSQGKPSDIVNTQMIRDVFSLDAVITHDPIYGTPMCIPQSHLIREQISER